MITGHILYCGWVRGCAGAIKGVQYVILRLSSQPRFLLLRVFGGRSSVYLPEGTTTIYTDLVSTFIKVLIYSPIDVAATPRASPTTVVK